MSRIARIATLIFATAACTGIGRTQGEVASWLDEATPAAWNAPGRSIPAAPRIEDAIDARCRETSRPPELEADERLRAQGWDPVGPYHGGWQVLVVQATAGYDGMCRPRQYQAFVFVRGAFAGTLAPDPMDSRSDGALARVSLQGENRLTAEYLRYAQSDALCCPSQTTSVVFEIAGEEPVVRPVSASTTSVSDAGASEEPAATPSSRLAGTAWQLVAFEGGDGTKLIPDDRAKYTIAFGADGRVSARIDCNRGSGTWESQGPGHIAFGPLALTRAMCPPGSLYDQVARQWGNIRSYVIEDGHLFLALMADGGIYEYEPVPRASEQ